ncbi:iron ABC transporter permease [Nocardioides sp. AE5]|uniref:ABC transporter permease n=1 Tax=Nocardioides sp. AE5 TaxID=2962573 RepID=UPI0028821EC4|nr:iron ABC transporter permease [Nocardioides sp. AE5]MDT0200318.1 iron ABC transporter permease [Nocardioides sp. AE5]
MDRDSVLGSVARGQMLDWTLNSVVLVTAVGGSCLVLGTATAWLLTCTTLPGRGLWLVAAAMPLAVPSYVAAYGWMTTFPLFHGFWPSWMVLTAVCTPYVTLPTVAAMRRADMTLVEIARVSGRRPATAWLVGLGPQVAPAAAAGTLLAALYALSDFGAVALLRFQVLPYAIHRQYNSFLGRDRAAVLALILVVGALLLVLAERRTRGNSDRWSVSRGAARPVSPIRIGAWAGPATAVVALPVMVGVVLPVIALFRRMLLGTRRPLDWADLASAVQTTAAVSLMGGALALVMASFIGVLAARFHGRLVGVVETLSFSSHALPGIVVGLALVYFSMRAVPGLYQSIWVLVFAYAVLFMPKAIGAVRTAVAAVPPTLGQVAATLGRNPVQSGLLTARLAAPGVMAGFLLVVVTVMKELPATLMLRPTGMETLATEIWDRTSSIAHGSAAPYALALVLLASVPAFFLSRRSTWGER